MISTKYPSEHEEQVAFINWFRSKYPNYFIFAVPNGGNRNKIEASRLKKEGVTAGVPDLIALGMSKVCFIEMKRQKGGRLSKIQKDTIPKIEQLGFDVLVCYGFKDAVEKFEGLQWKKTQ